MNDRQKFVLCFFIGIILWRRWACPVQWFIYLFIYLFLNGIRKASMFNNLHSWWTNPKSSQSEWFCLTQTKPGNGKLNGGFNFLRQLLIWVALIVHQQFVLELHHGKRSFRAGSVNVAQALLSRRGFFALKAANALRMSDRMAEFSYLWLY